MALGAGSVTPMQMAAGYAVFANGGYRVNPSLITQVTDHKGRVLFSSQPHVPSEEQRAIDPRNAFIMNNLLQEIARTGTAARAQATLKRPDLFGKTGTTNDAVDAWFVGFQPTLVAAAWVGYDRPRNLGSRETGGGLSLPIWIDFMKEALKNVPETQYEPPAGVVNVGGDWYYEEYGPGQGVSSLGLNDPWPGRPELVVPPGLGGNGGPPLSVPPPPEDRRSILDLFRN
jgi:penicillin-binding protein 1A